MKILVINGPNLNMLGIREPDIYGKATYDDLVEHVKQAAERLDIAVDFYQSNHEGDLVDRIQQAYGVYDGIVINPAAYTHTSVALLDAVKSVGIPTVEVHISDVREREDFRQVSYIRLGCIGTVMGKGFDGYVEALEMLIKADGGKPVTCEEKPESPAPCGEKPESPVTCEEKPESPCEEKCESPAPCEEADR